MFKDILVWVGTNLKNNNDNNKIQFEVEIWKNGVSFFKSFFIMILIEKKKGEWNTPNIPDENTTTNLKQSLFHKI